MTEPVAALRYAHRARRRTLQELARLLAFQTVSSDASRAGEMRRCATWLGRHLRRMGLTPTRLETAGGPPLLVARSPDRPGLPRMLVYGHYDVQPADEPGWRTPPFAATRIGADLFARGAADNKGPFFAHLKAVEAIVRTAGRLPVNVTFLLDGEEEVGSPHLRDALMRHRAELDTDLVVVSDTRIAGPRQPVLISALRGSITADLRVDGPPVPLHAGAFGGAVHNPAQALADVVSSLHDEWGMVALPGFYPEQRPGRHPGKRSPARLSAYERTTGLPALSVTHLAAGSARLGAIPASAGATLNIRTVAGQDTARVVAGLRRHIAMARAATVSTHLSVRSAADPVRVPVHHAGTRLAAAAYERGFGRRPVLRRSGGTIPAVAHLQQVLHAPIVLMGFTPPDARIHAPNERMHLPVFWRAVDTSVWLFVLAGGFA